VGGVDSLRDVKKYSKRYKVTYPLLIDSNNSMVEAYSIYAIPTVILLDESGKILFRDNEPPEKLDEFLRK
jgi:peroxiredoxin